MEIMSERARGPSAVKMRIWHSGEQLERPTGAERPSSNKNAPPHRRFLFEYAKKRVRQNPFSSVRREKLSQPTPRLAVVRGGDTLGSEFHKMCITRAEGEPLFTAARANYCSIRGEERK